MGHKVSTRARGRRRTVRERRLAVRRSLTAAAAAPLLPNYDMTRGEPGERFFFEQAFGAGFEDFNHDQWPCDAPMFDATKSVYRDGNSAVFRNPDGTLAHVRLGGGWMSIRVAASDPSAVEPVFAAFRAAYPPSYMTQVEDFRVPITFWANSQFGPTARLRKVDSAMWGDITGNYTAPVEAQLADLMSWENGPPSKDGGQLILWQGPPGTGKSWALRALASEWAPWAEFHYITDPDSFFVDDPSYMINVLLADSYEAIDEPTGDIYNEQRDGKWRILILEDTGELLSANAKEKYGQGLSRLLNVVDGMIGQGLKVLALVTTNDELGDLHPAVTRPGRCAAQIEFGPLTADEAAAWTGDADATAGTLAELYSKYGKASEDAIPADAHDGEPDPEEAYALMASGMIPIPGTDHFIPRDAFESALRMVRAAVAEDEAANDLRARIFEVAQAHADEAEGCGQTAWHEADGAVLYVAGDWTDTDPIEADFLAIDGVNEFRYEMEALPTGWWDAEVVYPENPPAWVTEPPDEEAALASVVALALAPLPPDEDEPDTEPLVASSDATAAAIAALREAHDRTVSGIQSIVASGAAVRERERDDSRVDRALDLAEIALRASAAPPPPAPAAPDVHVHLPEREFNLRVETPPVHVEVAPTPVHIDMPATPAPIVHVAAAEPVVVQAPPVEVTVEAARAPDVHVHHHAAEPTKARAVRVEVDADGTKRYVIEEEEE